VLGRNCKPEQKDIMKRLLGTLVCLACAVAISVSSADGGNSQGGSRQMSDAGALRHAADEQSPLRGT